MSGKQARSMDLLDRMLGHDAWTTQQLLDVAATLTDDQLDHAFEIGHRTIRKTFNHVIWNMECWTDLMKGGSVRTRPDDRASIADLSRRLEIVSEELYDFARTVTDQGRLNETFADHLESPSKHHTFGGTLLHLATHGMHHRAQLLFMLRRSGASDLPEGDALSWERSTSRRNETPSVAAEYTIDSMPLRAEIAFLDDQLKSFNAQATGRDDFQPLNLVIRDSPGTVIAGLNAVTGWDWLHVQVLWVDKEHRRAGLGSRLIEEAEREAARRNCIGACLSSYSFQAPEFYHRLGYSTFGRIDDYPVDRAMFFLSKRF